MHCPCQMYENDDSEAGSLLQIHLFLIILHHHSSMAMLKSSQTKSDRHHRPTSTGTTTHIFVALDALTALTQAGDYHVLHRRIGRGCLIAARIGCGLFPRDFPKVPQPTTCSDGVVEGGPLGAVYCRVQGQQTTRLCQAVGAELFRFSMVVTAVRQQSGVSVTTPLFFSLKFDHAKLCKPHPVLFGTKTYRLKLTNWFSSVSRENKMNGVLPPLLLNCKPLLAEPDTASTCALELKSLSKRRFPRSNPIYVLHAIVIETATAQL